MKTHDIEIQKLKALRHDKGAVELRVDALVSQRAASFSDDEQTPSTTVRLSVEDARSLLMLLKQKFAELDKLQPRSRRSGRA